MTQDDYEKLQSLIPEGWKLVPIIPTEEMCIAGKVYFDDMGDECKLVYEAMINASISPIETIHGDWDEKRLDVIGQNGNDGLHYKSE